MEIIGGKYKIGNRRLGKGGFAEVFLGVDVVANRKVAIKKVPLMHELMTKEEILIKLNLEIDLMQKLKHPNIVEYYDVIKTDSAWYIVMEYCNAGTLQNVIEFNEMMSRKKILDFDREANTYYYMRQLKDALDYLRQKDHVHRDIKPMNILLTMPIEQPVNNPLETSLEDFGTIFKSDEQLKASVEITNFNHSEKLVLKLADFGLAKSYIEDDEFMMKTLCGSPLYMAPELLMGGEYTSKADLWSCGVIMYELLLGSHPTPAKELKQLISKVKTASIDFHTEKNFTPYCFDLLKRLLVKNVDKRIEWVQFFNHKWFTYWKRVFDGEKPEIQLEHSRELGTSYDRIVKRAFSSPPMLGENSVHLNVSSTIPETTKPVSPIETSTNISPLGSSNLSKMKTDSFYSRSYTPGSYSDYPSSYPPTDPRRQTTQPLAISVRRLGSTDSQFFNSPKREIMDSGHSGYSKSYGASPQSRIFKYFFKKDEDETKTSITIPPAGQIIDDYQGGAMRDQGNAPKKSDPITIKKR